MLIIERCGFCVHYKPIEGIFGNCKKKKNTTFSSNPKCEVFIYRPKCEGGIVQPEWNAKHQKKHKHIPRKIISFDEERAKREIGK